MRQSKHRSAAGSLFVCLLMAWSMTQSGAIAALADDGTTSDRPDNEVAAEVSTARTEATDQADPPRPDERARRTYMGRIVAQPMSHLGASWLIRPERNDEENALEALSELDIKPGMTVVDLGCGNGYWTLPMARECARPTPPRDATAVEDSTSNHDAAEAESLDGQVLAVDIQPQMLQKLRQNMLRAGIENVQPILGKVDDPRLPAGQVDLVLLVDVYHEFSHPQSMLWAIRRSLKPNGVIALLEYRAEDPDVPIKPLHKMPKNQIMKEYAASNLKLVREYNDLPWQHLMFFARDDSPLPEIEPK